MRMITLFLFILSTSVLAKDREEVINTRAWVYVAFDLKCVVYPGLNINKETNDRFMTQLSGDAKGKLQVSPKNKEALELEHFKAMTKGCELEKLDKIALAAEAHFGYLELPIEVSKKWHTFVNKAGECRGTYTEILKIDLGEGIVVQSTNGKAFEAKDCK